MKHSYVNFKYDLCNVKSRTLRSMDEMEETMMYRFIDCNTPQDHDAFVTKHDLCNLLQSSDWARVKDNWQHAYTAVLAEEKMVAAALVLIKPLPLGYTMMYIPKGPVMDYEDKALVAFYLNALKKWAKKKKCLFITFDPALKLREFKLDQKDMPYDEKVVEAIDTLKKNGAIFKGFTKSIKDTIQPRFHMGLYYSDHWEDSIPKSTMKSVRKAINKRVEVEEVGMEGLEEFARIMHLTEERKSVHLRDQAYFKKLLEVYKDHAHIFLAKVDPAKREQELNLKIAEINEKMKDEKLKEKGQRKLQEDMRKATEELSSIQEVKKVCDKETIIACGLMIGYGNYVEMLYAGMDENFKAFRPQYLIYLKQFELAFQQGYQFVTMGGVEGTLDDGLSVFKSNFDPTVVEYVGEFDVPVKSMLYKMAKLFQKLRTGK